ncbi:ABC transporter permease [Priestia megaterium]|uniref:ABC transporter permease n=1 Tax=Priestia megaterium TaxID=1404 RepID=UPI0025704C93|nr:ABC transporter permease [Priestia megaterium]WJD83663.1 ABC transporter permease [Priestia megaterium]
MNKFWALVKQTYKSKIYSKSFFITTLISIIVVALAAITPQILNKFENNDDTKIALVTTTPSYIKTIKNQVKGVTIQNGVKNEESAEKLLTDNKIDGYLTITNKNQNLVANLKTLKPAKEEVVSEITNTLQSIKIENSTKNLNLSTNQVNSILTPVLFENEVVSLQKKDVSAKEEKATNATVIAVLFLIYIFVMLYGSMIATEIAKEKGSRIMEIIVSSVSSTTHLVGKLTGILLISVTQFSILGLASFFVIKYLGSKDLSASVVETVSNIPTQMFLYALIFCILGYLLYGILAALIGSIVVKVEDVGQYFAPITYLIIGTFVMSTFAVSNPSATWATVGSYIPFFSPMLMFVRIGLTNVSMIEVVTSISILAITILVLLYFSIKLYRGSVLLYNSQSLFKSAKKVWQVAVNK